MPTTTTPRTPHPCLQGIAPNRWHNQPDPDGYRLSGHYWARFEYVVLKRYANGWHVGFTNDPMAETDQYWHSGINEDRARHLFAVAQGTVEP